MLEVIVRIFIICFVLCLYFGIKHFESYVKNEYEKNKVKFYIEKQVSFGGEIKFVLYDKNDNYYGAFDNILDAQIYSEKVKQDVIKEKEIIEIK